MAVPRKKVSKSCRNMRRSHHALTAINLVPCDGCKAPRLPHSACESCGFYKGRYIPRQYLQADLIALLK